MRQFLSQPRCEPEENCYLAESDGELAGLLLISPELPIKRAVASGGVLPWYRKRGIGSLLLNNALHHVNSLGAAMLHVQASTNAISATHLLESHRFQVVRKYVSMRWVGHTIPATELPPGFNLHSLSNAGNIEAFTHLQNDAFQGNWGFCPNTRQDVEARINFKTCDPSGVILITYGKQLAAYNWTFRTGTTGQIGMMGVHPDYRGNKLGKNVVLHGMNYLKSKGAMSIELEVDEWNTPALNIYQSIGFVPVHRTLWYEKSL